jgi:hypothetical protein
MRASLAMSARETTGTSRGFPGHVDTERG